MANDQILTTGRGAGAEIGSSAETRHAHIATDERVRQNTREEQGRVFALLQDPNLRRAVDQMAANDPELRSAVAQLLTPGGAVIPGVQKEIERLMKESGINERQARAMIVSQIMEEALNRGEIQQGARALCVEAQFARNRLSKAEYVHAICDLATKGETELASGCRLIAPPNWSHYIERDRLARESYAVQEAGEDLLMSSMSLMLVANKPGASAGALAAEERQGITGNWAFEARDKLDLITGREHFVMWNELGLLFAMEQRGQHPELGVPEMSLKWAPNGDHVNHCLGLQGVNPGDNGEIIISNGWGTPNRANHNVKAEGPLSREILGASEGGLETISRSDAAARMNWALVDADMHSIIVNDTKLRQAGIDSKAGLDAIVDDLKSRGVDNIEVVDRGDGTYEIKVDLSRQNQQPDLSKTEDYGITGFELWELDYYLRDFLKKIQGAAVVKEPEIPTAVSVAKPAEPIKLVEALADRKAHRSEKDPNSLEALQEKDMQRIIAAAENEFQAMCDKRRQQLGVSA